MLSEKIHWPSSAKPYTTPCGLKWNVIKPNGRVIQTRGAGSDLRSFFMWPNRCSNCARMVKKRWGVPNIFDAGARAS